MQVIIKLANASPKIEIHYISKDQENRISVNNNKQKLLAIKITCIKLLAKIYEIFCAFKLDVITLQISGK